MTPDKKRLTLFEASAVIAGLGIGGGIMAVPYLSSRNGLIPILVILAAAYLISVLLHLMVAEMALRDPGRSQLVELFGKYLFNGRLGSVLTWAFFGLIVFSFYSLLAGYVAGCGEVLKELLGIPLWAGELIAYAAASGVVFFGLKAVGLSEKYSILGFGVIMAVLAGGSLGHPLHPIPLFSDNLRAGLALYGMIMFSFACFFSIPQAIEGLIWKPKLVPWSVLIGIGINLVCILAITLMALSLSKQVTPVAVIGWGKEVGGWVLILGSVFALLAMLTSYWAVSYALAVIIQQRLKWPYRLSWLSATLPSLIIALSGITGFLGFMRITGGAMAVMVAIMVIPALRKSRKLAPAGETAFSLGSWGGIFFQIIVILAYILMALGSVVSIK